MGAEPVTDEAQEIFAFGFIKMLSSLRCWIKNRKVRGRIRGKTVTIFDPDFRAAVQDAGFT